MVKVHPFSALRFNEAVVGSLDAVIAPPYDVISPEAQEELHKQSPYNIVHLELGKVYDDDDEADNRYTRATNTYKDWLAKSALIKDDVAAFYVTEHTFRFQGATMKRMGFFGLLEFEGGGEPQVYRHEATLAAPKKDRTQLLDAVPVNLSPVFCVFPDEEETVQSLLLKISESEPAYKTTVGEQSVRVWRVSDETSVSKIQTHLAANAVMIADGHHRFEVASTRKDRYGAVMVFFASMSDPALVVWPIHRIVACDPVEVRKAVEPLFSFEAKPSQRAMLEWLNAQEKTGRLGCYYGGTFYAVTANATALEQWLDEPALDPALADLDVSVLHQWLLPAAGVDHDDVKYWANPDTAQKAVDEGDAGMAWFVRGIPLEKVYALAKAGHYLSPKSTYFFPKVLSGLTLNSHEGDFVKRV